MNRNIWVVRIGQAIVFLFALLWIVAGTTGIPQNGQAGTAPIWMLRTMAAGMILYAISLVGFSLGLGLGKKNYYYLTLGLLVIGGLLTILIDLGSIDTLVLLMAAIAFIYFIANRRWFI